MVWLGLRRISFPLVFASPRLFDKPPAADLCYPCWTVILIGLCYWFFNGKITQLTSLQAVAVHLGAFDVRLRLGIFIVSVIIPPLYFMAPLFGKWKTVRRHTTPIMTAYIVAMLVVLVHYIVLTLFPNDFLFYSFGMVAILFCFFFSIIFLLYENPLSIHGKEAVLIAGGESLADILYVQIDTYLKENHPFTNPEYTIDELAVSLNTRPVLVVEAIKSGGFSGFREYMNYLRIEYFKLLAQVYRSHSVKELMYSSGFVSRSTFYRLFSGYENMTPTEYIERLYYT